MKGKTDKGVRIMAALLSAWSLFGLFGCGKRPAPVSGGIVDQTDSKAPKTIVSKEITAFSADFYLRGEWSPGETGRTYAFEIVPDETGALSAAETGAGIRFPADEALLTALQDMIDEEKLAEKNGVVRYTAGLPPEFQPCHAAVDYASGERLRFTVGNDPDAAWAKRTYLIFADWFAGKGDASLLPPRKTDPVKQVILTLKENKICGRESTG